MIQIQQLKLRANHSPEQLKKKVASLLRIPEQDILRLERLRQSIDARKKPDIFYIYCVEAQVNREEQVLKNAQRRKGGLEKIGKSERVVYQYPKAREGKAYEPAVVVGAGPGGLFCAYLLALAGLRPILLERGCSVEERQAAVENFWQTGRLDGDSNVQFGEGGAGTFSDGKLNTLVKDKEGRNRAVLEIFVKFGADERILYDAKPHIGTDVLAVIVSNMRKEIIALGGQVRFQSRVTDILLEGDRVAGVMINDRETLACRQVVLAIGHSARDTFQMLYERGIPMEAKAFAVGFRVEHPQEMINRAQYGMAQPGFLGAAPYKLAAQASNGRSVYSFCMCPGGYVVNASSQEGYLAVNGMSYSGRDGRNANSAIIVSVDPKDYGSAHPLAGVAFQRQLEKRAYELAGGKIPVQSYGDFKRHVAARGALEEASGHITPCCKGDYAWADLSGILPEECNQAFVEGMEQFGRQIPGFNRSDAVLSGVESRTSSPVRIPRDKELQSVIKGLYPCGEGAGYAGGITSAAMDGMRVAEAIIKGESQGMIDGRKKIK
ncbi:MAG: FAD-dependent oxidoreductase [Roseburia sp.]|nr:FAD-dependent oxidoreductase [Roseburia sp.]